MAAVPSEFYSTTGNETAHTAIKGDTNPYAPPLTESKSASVVPAGARVIEYDLSARDLTAGIRDCATTTAFAFGGIILFAGILLGSRLIPEWGQSVPTDQRPLLVGTCVVVVLLLSIATFVVTMMRISRSMREQLLATPLFAPGTKRVACYGNMVWLEAAGESYQFKYPGSQQHGRHMNRIVLSSQTAVLVVPRFAVATDDYDYLVNSIKEQGFPLK